MTAQSITFDIGNVEVTLSETNNGQILFQLAALKPNVNILGLFFDVGDDQTPLPPGLHFNSATNITSSVIAEEGVTSVGKGINMNGTGADPFDVGVAFGTGVPGRSPATGVHSTSFVLAAGDSPLSLDAFAHVDFGIMVAGGGQAKTVVVTPTPPNAVADNFNLNENATNVNLAVLANDTDPDGNALVITSAGGAAHGTIAIAPDHHSINYTPNAEYSGLDSFSYVISDGHGTASANVAMQVNQVADPPALSVQVEAGDQVNEIKLHVITATDDTDGSESINRVAFSGLPAGTQINEAPGNVFQTTGSPLSLDKVFTLMLPEGSDENFNLQVTSYSHANTNGAEAPSTTAVVPISFDSSTHSFNETFIANDQNIWGSGNALGFTYQHFFGIDQSIDIPVTVGPVYADLSGQVRAGLDANISVTAGQMDAQVPMAVTFGVEFNHTTNVLEIDPSALVTAGAEYEVTGPGGFIHLNLVANIGGEAKVGLDLPDLGPIQLGQIQLVDQPFSLVNQTQPLINLDSANLSQQFDFPSDDPVVTVTATWPNIDATGTQSGSTISSTATSGNVLQADLNVVQALADIFLDGVNPLSVSQDFDIPVLATGTIDADLIGLTASAGLNLIQSLHLAVPGMTGTITYENGAPVQSQQFTFGQPLVLTNASAYDTNNDGHVDFSISLHPDATLQNTTSVGLNVGVDFNLVQGTVSVTDGLAKDALALLGVDNPLSFGPLVDLSPSAQVATVPVYDPAAFAFNFQSQNVDFFAT
jgi:hypothetical protein